MLAWGRTDSRGKEIKMAAAVARAVRFDRYGGRDELYVADIDMPSPGPGEVVVEVRAAGINPGEVGAKTEGSAETSTPEVLTEMANLVATGAIDFEIADTYPLDRVADAYEELEKRHTRGKIVLLPHDSK
jgi:NADPH:quinone reductase-like Zn-dependent oxidoreductase